jgi:hypothetical protein
MAVQDLHGGDFFGAGTFSSQPRRRSLKKVRGRCRVWYVSPVGHYCKDTKTSNERLKLFRRGETRGKSCFSDAGVFVMVSRIMEV